MSNHKAVTTTKAEPAMIRGIVVAVLALLASLGCSWAAHVDEHTLAAIVTIAAVLVPILQALWTRHAVTPNAKVISQVTSSGKVVAGDAATEPTGSDVSMADRMNPPVAMVAVKPELLGRHIA